jgi:hypothetical protein
MLENPVHREPNHNPLKTMAETFLLRLIREIKNDWEQEGSIDVGLLPLDFHILLLQYDPEYAELCDNTPENGENPLLIWLMEKLGSNEQVLSQAWARLLADFPPPLHPEETKIDPKTLLTETQLLQIKTAVLKTSQYQDEKDVLTELIKSYTRDGQQAKDEFIPKVIAEIVAERTEELAEDDEQSELLLTSGLPIALGRSRLEDEDGSRWVFSLMAQLEKPERIQLWDQAANQRLMSKLLTSEQFRPLLQEYLAKRVIDIQQQKREAITLQLHALADTRQREQTEKIESLQEILRKKFSEILTNLLDLTEEKSALLHYMTIEESGDWEGKTLVIKSKTNTKAEKFIEMSLPISTSEFFKGKKSIQHTKNSVILKLLKNEFKIGKKIEDEDSVSIEWLNLETPNNSPEETNQEIEEILELIHSISLQDLAKTGERHSIGASIQHVHTLEDFQNILNYFKKDKKLFFDVTPGKIRFMIKTPQQRAENRLN